MEILVVAIVALVVLGPSRLPDAAKQAGKALSELRRWSSSVTDELTSVTSTSPSTPTAPDRKPDA